MNKTQLQVSAELWDCIIDLVGVESNTDPIVYYPNIRTYCLVCPLWLPRSRYNIYREVAITEELSRSGQSRVCCIARTVCESSDFVHLIKELHLHPKVLGRAIPLVVAGPGDWVSSMVFLRSLKFVGVGWHPALYSTAVSRFPALAHLELRHIAFDAASGLFSLIWSLPHLASLTLDQVTIRKMSAMQLAKLSLACPRAGLTCLTELSIFVRSLCSEFGFLVSPLILHRERLRMRNIFRLPERLARLSERSTSSAHQSAGIEVCPCPLPVLTSFPLNVNDS